MASLPPATLLFGLPLAAAAPSHAGPLRPAHPQMSYLDKPWFGECPPYLQRRMREIEAERERAAHEQQADEVRDALGRNHYADVLQHCAGGGGCSST